MNPEEYPNNSHMAKEEQKKAQETPEKPEVKSVVTGNVVKKKKTLGDKIKETFIAEDIHTVAHYVYTDSIVPKLKDLALSIITNGANMLINGTSAKPVSSNTRHATPYGSRVSYRSYYDSPNNSTPVRASSANAFDLEDYVFDTRGDAELVLDQLTDIISTYGQATVSDYYDSCGVTSAYTTVDYGWRSLARAYVERTDRGYIIKFPRVVPLR